MSKPSQSSGIAGEIVSVSPRKWNPRTSSIQMRYIHPAEPVYQVQPARPSLPGENETSAGETYGSPLKCSVVSGVRLDSMGFINFKSLTAALPLPRRAHAAASHNDPCVYWPPF